MRQLQFHLRVGCFFLFCLGWSSLHAQLTIRPALGEYEQGAKTFLPYRPLQRPKVGLVLSGGGARGVAQIGVLRVLEQHRVPIDLIVGSSMGAIVGGLYASGYTTTELESIAVHTDWNDVLALTDEAKRRELFVDQKITADRSLLVIRFEGLAPVIPSAVSSGQRLTNFLSALSLGGIYHPNPSFDELKIPLRIVTTDLISGQRVVLEDGSLTEAMRASMTVPLLFHPVEKGSMQLLDGGLVSNLPADVARTMGCDIVIAVNTTSGLRSGEDLQAPWQTAEQIMGIMMQLSNEMQLKQADIVIAPEAAGHLSSDFTGLDSLIIRGEAATREVMSKILEIIASTGADDSADTIVFIGDVEVQFFGDPIPDEIRQSILSEAMDGVLTRSEVQRHLGSVYDVGDYQDVYAEVNVGSDRAFITYHAVSNPVLRSVVFEGNRFLSDSALMVAAEPMLGKVINFHEGKQVLENILTLYRRQGYSLAKIDSVSFDWSTGAATLRMNEGIIAGIDVHGNGRTKDYVVLREFPLSSGDVFTAARATEGIVNINSTNLFESVLLEVRYDGSNPRIVLRVKERSSKLLRLGFRADNERNVQGLVEVRDENVFGTGMEFGVGLSGGPRNRHIRFEHKANRIFRTYLTFNLKGFHHFRDVNVYLDKPMTPRNRWVRQRVGEYRLLRYGGSFTFGSQFERLGNVIAEARMEQQEIRALSGTGFIPEKYFLVSIKVGSTVDTQDRYPFPREGMVLTMFYESALSSLGSDISFTKLMISYELYKSVLGSHTLHPKLTVGLADETLPLAEQFSLGGHHSFFGLREDDFRGRQIFLVNLEYRIRSPFRLLFDTYLSARYDFGSVWRAPSDISVNTFRHGVGLQIALDTPMGSAEFALGRSFLFRTDLPSSPISLGPYEGYFTVGIEL
ncbi:MAG: patatin-like phospholipase family protein [Bacteroidota bacterium]